MFLMFEDPGDRSYTVSKREAAERLLVFAIRSYFERKDPLAVHLLAANVGILIYDLSEAVEGYEGMETRIAKTIDTDIGKVLNELRKESNFLKHARHPGERDQHLRIEVDARKTEDILWFASMNLDALLGHPHHKPIAVSAFDLWWFAVRWAGQEKSTLSNEVWQNIRHFFPEGFEKWELNDQKKKGLEAIKEFSRKFMDGGWQPPAS